MALHNEQGDKGQLSPWQQWPPPFTLCKHPRARRVRLKICVKNGLQLIVPSHFVTKRALDVLHQHRAWIETTWAKVYAAHTLCPSLTDINTLSLRALSEEWRLEHRHSSSTRIKLEASFDTLILHSQPQFHAQAQAILTRWLHCYAEQHLLAWLARLSQQVALPYHKATIRNAHTRWGSCSGQKAIMLNVKLLFLPPALVEYVMLHELCHTVHLNHSPDFWQLLAGLSPNWKNLRRQLKEANRYIPSILH